METKMSHPELKIRPQIK